MRRGFLIFIFVVFLFGGFFILQNYSQASLTPIVLVSHDGVKETTNWTCKNCEESKSADVYLILNKSTSTLVSSERLLPECDNASLSYSLRISGGVVVATSNRLVVDVSLDGGVTWSNLVNLLALSDSLIKSEPVDISAYCTNNIMIKFSSPDATGTKGIGIDKIKLEYTPKEVNQLPIANAGADKEGIVDEELEFADGGSTDDGNIVNWFWNFGSEIKNGSTTSFTFTSTGTKSVFLQVLDNAGATSTFDELFVLVKDKPDIVTTSTATTTPTSTAIIIKPTDLVINEVLPAPDEGDEWVEIFNNTSSTIDLSELRMLDLRAGKFTTTTLTGSISAHGFAVVNNIAGSLNNTGDTLVLETIEGLEIDQVAYPSFSTGNYSWARVSDGVDSNSNADFALTITPTAGTLNIITAKPVAVSSGGSGGSGTIYKPENIVKTATTTATTSEQLVQLVINEVLPNPAGADDQNEFIEIKNIGTTTANILDFYLTDGSNKKYSFKSSIATVLAGGFITIYSAESKISLNNTGQEIVSLYYPSGKLLDQLEYTSNNKENWSYARTAEDDWEWTSSPTPTKDNIFAGVEVIADETGGETTVKTVVPKVVTKSTKKVASNKVVNTVMLEEIYNYDVGTILKTTGIVTALPGTLGSQYFYLSSSGAVAGTQVYCYKKDFPDLKIGDQIEVIGELSKINGENRVKIKSRGDIRMVGSSPELTPRVVEELSEEDLGSLIRLTGEVIEIKGQNLYLDYGSGEAKVYFKAGINLQDLAPKLGEKMEVTGILSATASGLRLLPRSSADIKIIPGEVKSAYEKATPSSWPWQKYWPVFAIVGCLGVAWFVGRELLKKKV